MQTADFGFLPQESQPVGDETILQIATSGKKIAPDNDDDHDYDIDWTLEPRAKKILSGLGFREGDFNKQAPRPDDPVITLPPVLFDRFSPDNSSRMRSARNTLSRD